MRYFYFSIDFAVFTTLSTVEVELKQLVLGPTREPGHDNRAVNSHVFIPAVCRGRLNRDSRASGFRQNGFAVFRLCISNSAMDGILTTRTSIPSSRSLHMPYTQPRTPSPRLSVSNPSLLSESFRYTRPSASRPVSLYCGRSLARKISATGLLYS